MFGAKIIEIFFLRLDPDRPRMPFSIFENIILQITRLTFPSSSRSTTFYLKRTMQEEIINFFLGFKIQMSKNVRKANNSGKTRYASSTFSIATGLTSRSQSIAFYLQKKPKTIWLESLRFSFSVGISLGQKLQNSFNYWQNSTEELIFSEH